MAALSGFLGAGAAWAGAAAWQDLRNHHILSARIASLFHLPGPAGAIAATGAVGGIMGALGAWTGYTFRAWLLPRTRAADLPLFADARKAAADAAGSESSGGAVFPRPENGIPRADDDAGPALPGTARDEPLAGEDGEAGP
jgi:hypothetical protein